MFSGWKLFQKRRGEKLYAKIGVPKKDRKRKIYLLMTKYCHFQKKSTKFSKVY